MFASSTKFEIKKLDHHNNWLKKMELDHHKVDLTTSTTFGAKNEMMIIPRIAKKTKKCQ